MARTWTSRSSDEPAASSTSFRFWKARCASLVSVPFSRSPLSGSTATTPET
jgi:hypothetical protein